MKREGEGGRAFYGPLAIGSLKGWALNLTPAGWMLKAEGTFPRYWCEAKPQTIRVELVKMLPAEGKRGTVDAPLRPEKTTWYGTLVRIRPGDLMLKDVTNEPPKPASDDNDPARADDHP